MGFEHGVCSVDLSCSARAALLAHPGLVTKSYRRELFNVARVTALHLSPGPGHRDVFWLTVLTHPCLIITVLYCLNPTALTHPSALRTTAEPSCDPGFLEGGAVSDLCHCPQDLSWQVLAKSLVS